jgi:hypothetical protein
VVDLTEASLVVIGKSLPGMKVTSHLHMVLKVRKTGAIGLSSQEGQNS